MTIVYSMTICNWFLYLFQNYKICENLLGFRCMNVKAKITWMGSYKGTHISMVYASFPLLGLLWSMKPCWWKSRCLHSNLIELYIFLTNWGTNYNRKYTILSIMRLRYKIGKNVAATYRETWVNLLWDVTIDVKANIDRKQKCLFISIGIYFSTTTNVGHLYHCLKQTKFASNIFFVAIVYIVCRFSYYAMIVFSGIN